MNKLLTYAIMLIRMGWEGREQEKEREIMPISHEARFTPSSLRTIRDNADRITEGAKSGTKVFV